MANVRISELLLLSPPDLTDEIIVNDVDVLVTKRSTLQDIRDLANENIDDTVDGSQVTGNLTVTGTINGFDLNDFLTTADTNTLLCVRDSADDTCGVALLGDTRVDSDLLVLGNIEGSGDITAGGIFYGDGTGLTNIQFALRSDSAGLARKALFANYAGRADSAQFAYTADSADHARYSIEADWSAKQQVVNTNNDATYYPTFVGLSAGIDSVNTDLELFYNPNTNIFDAGFFRGDGSLLTNITADAGDANEIRANTTAVNSNHYVMFRFNATGLDSVNTDGNLLYNPATDTLGGIDSSDVHFFGKATTAFQHYANPVAATGTYSVMLRGKATDRDSTSTSSGISFDAATETLNATNFAGDGSALTGIDADTSINATNVAVTSVSDNAIYYVHMGSATSGNDGVNVDTALRVNPSTDTLSFASATGSLTLGTDSDFSITAAGTQYSFNVTNNGSSAYTYADTTNTFFPVSEDNPILYLRRGDTYRFDLNASGHPFEIRVSSGGAAYTTGVTDNSNNGVGQQFFAVPMSAPATLYYQCTVHSGMGNTINIV